MIIHDSEISLFAGECFDLELGGSHAVVILTRGGADDFAINVKVEARLALVCLFSRWAGWLAEGGAVVVVNRARDLPPERELRLDESAARSLQTLLSERLRERGTSAHLLATLERRAAIYVKRVSVFPLSEEEICARLAAAGLSVVHRGRMTSGDPRNDAARGIAVAAGATHACVVATKPRR